MKHHHFHILLFASYIILATLIMIIEGVGITPDRYLFVLLVAALFLHKGKKFIHDFLPFVLIIIAYDFLRGIAPQINKVIHYQFPIQLSQLIFFGHLPTIDLQKAFYTPGNLHWYDYAGTVLYAVHFAVPLIFAFLLWFFKRREFVEMMVGLCSLSYGGLLAFLLFPVAPPWLASQKGFIPPVTKIFNVVLNTFPNSWHLPTVYQAIGSNLVAAIPSLHAGYSFLVFLYAVKFLGKAGWWFVIYPAAMWLTTIYFGEHYLIDVLAGGAFALFFFWLSGILIKHWGNYLQLI